MGDSLDDMTAGHRAGTATILLANADNQDLKVHKHTGSSIDRLDQLIQILEEGYEDNPDE